MTAPELRPVVGVVPAAARGQRAALFDALEQALDVRVEGRDDGAWQGLDGVIRVAPASSAERPALPLLDVADSSEPPAGPVAEVRLASTRRLDRVLRGARLHDAHARPLPPPAAGAGEEVLASAGDAPAWTCAGQHHRTGALPDELADGEALRDRLAPGRNLSLLVLVHVLREVAGERAWTRPPLRAAFILDDPNLQWPTYGHVHYQQLARAAARDDHHVAMAMVPLDGWPVHPRAARLFRDHADRLSLLVHGNDHLGPELGRPATEPDARAVASQALRRMAAFERRSGVPVSRVMAPPHERASEPLMRALAGCGYEAVTTTRPYPWVATPGRHWLARPEGAGALAGWPVADVVCGELPVLLRQAFPHPREDLVLRAFLGQALIVYGHHDDLAGGPDLLAEVAAEIRALGDVRWGSLSALARGGADTRRAGDVLEVRLHARRVELDLPSWATHVRVTAPAGGLSMTTATLAVGDAATSLHRGAATPVPDGAGASRRVFVALPDAVAGAAAPVPRLRAWPVARRLAAQGRDRIGPLVTRRRISRTPAR